MKKTAIAKLIDLFPTIAGTRAGLTEHGLNVREFLEYLEHRNLSSGGALAAQYIASLFDSDFSFSAAKAFHRWDNTHRQAFALAACLFERINAA